MNTNEQPFFAKYLEGQECLDVKTNIKAGPTTQKFPSDSEDVSTTLKYPSDAEDAG
ncbi:MAG TPA: microviridin/marinostatin family tricyclic proteinase inhibitor [Blastocatellia bacterium]|nr:microviridin/marinostatin family tricyclic proteinase inhibitor [Blastocatellia bacterium]